MHAARCPPAEPPDGQTATVDIGAPPDDAGLVWLTQTDASGLARAEAACSQYRQAAAEHGLGPAASHNRRAKLVTMEAMLSRLREERAPVRSV